MFDIDQIIMFVMRDRLVQLVCSGLGVVLIVYGRLGEVLIG